MRTLCCLLIVCLAVAAAREISDDARIWQEISALKEKQTTETNEIAQLRQELQDLKTDRAGSRGLNLAAFSVVLRGGNVNVNPGERAPYNTVLTNVGNGYSTATHQFTAQTPGTYVLSFTVYAHNVASNCVMRLVHNNADVVEAFGTSNESRQRMGTNLAVLELSAGDTLFVKAHESTCILDGTWLRASFSGFQI